MAHNKNPLFCGRTTWQGRRAIAIGNEVIRMIVLPGGGHIADFRLSSGPDVSPLWVPPWQTIEPYQYDEKVHREVYGTTTEGKLLSGLVGHNICLDYFGSPSPEEAALGLSQHGEAPSSRWRVHDISLKKDVVKLSMSVRLPVSGLDFQREIATKSNQPIVYFTEAVQNTRKADHFFHWTQHVTLGGRFLDQRATSVSIPGDRSITFPHDEGKPLLQKNTEFLWPHAPLQQGGTIDLTNTLVRNGRGFVVAVLLKKEKNLAFIAAVNRELGLLIAYCFKRTDFPWVAVWEENLGIAAPPWNGKAQARGLEFSTTPLPVTRREAFMSGHVLGETTHTVVPALETKTVKYIALLARVSKEFSQLRDIEFESDGVVLVAADSKPIVIHAPGVRSHVSE